MTELHTSFPRDLLRFTTAGSVDDGKSTLIGRMLYDSKQVFQDQMDALHRASRLRGEETVDLALITDGLRAEREQRITIDVAYRYFSTPKRKFIIADTPGHEQYTRNMVTGASTADLAIILVDARKGLLPQSRRHAIIASLLAIPHVVVAINKMDLVNYAEDRYRELVREFTEFAEKLNLRDLSFIPISALHGDLVVEAGPNMNWYEGRPLLDFLEEVTITGGRNLIDFRFPVQCVLRPHQDFRGFAGRLASGTIRTGETVTVLPSMFNTRIRSILINGQEVEQASAHQSVVLTLTDEIDISRGDMLVRNRNLPVVDREFDAYLCWMDETATLEPGRNYLLQHTTRVCPVQVNELLYRMDVNTLHRVAAGHLQLNEIGRVRCTAAQPLFFDPYERNRETGGFILIDPANFRTVGAGMIRYTTKETLQAMRRDKGETQIEQTVATNITWDQSLITLAEREKQNQHKALCLWMTGLSGSGKSTIARYVERALFEEKRQAFRLDGDNVRHGLCADLGFSRADRKTNIHRIGHAAKLLYDAGHVVICSFISPYAEDRDFVRSLFPEDAFLEVYVECDIEVCKQRDPKGLYAKAARGEIKGFTGIDDPYEEPPKPELRIDTSQHTVEACVAQILDAVRRHS
jgi:bifunctional enzyme CysN/CysC